MILHEINNKMPIYKDCTLSEILVVGALVFSVISVVLSLIAKLVFGYAFIGLVLSLVCFFHTAKYILSRLQRMKYGKPYGYYQQVLIKKFMEMKLINETYITYQGRWSARREQ